MADLLTIGSAARITNFIAWEGTHTVEITWGLTAREPARVTDFHELFTAQGGWPIAWFHDFAAWRKTQGPVQPGEPSFTTLPLDEPNPVAGRFIHMTAVPDAGGGEIEVVTHLATIAADQSTIWKPGIEWPPGKRARKGNLPDAWPQGDLRGGRMIGLQGPVEALDLIVPTPAGRKVERWLPVTGMFINLLKDARLEAFFADPFANKPRRWHLRLRDVAKGRDILDRPMPLLDEWPGFRGTKVFDDAPGRFAMFHAAFPVDDDFTSGILTLEFDLDGRMIRYETSAVYRAADTLHLPLDPPDRLFRNARINFGNGPAEPGLKITTHGRDPKQRYAYDLGARVNGKTRQGRGGTLEDYYAFRQPVLALADGKVIRVEMSAEDRPNSSEPPEPNRVVVEHEHPDGKRFAVYAHCRRDSALVSPGDKVAAGQQLAEIGNNGNSGEPHLHLAYYGFDEYGHMRLLPMAFTVAGTGRTAITGVPRSDQELEPPFGEEAAANRSILGQLVDLAVEVGRMIVARLQKIFG